MHVDRRLRNALVVIALGIASAATGLVTFRLVPFMGAFIPLGILLVVIGLIMFVHALRRSGSGAGRGGARRQEMHAIEDALGATPMVDDNPGAKTQGRPDDNVLRGPLADVLSAVAPTLRRAGDLVDRTADAALGTTRDVLDRTGRVARDAKDGATRRVGKTIEDAGNRLGRAASHVGRTTSGAVRAAGSTVQKGTRQASRAAGGTSSAARKTTGGALGKAGPKLGKR